MKSDTKIRKALHLHRLVEQDGRDSRFEAAMRHSLRSPLKKYKPGHFATLASRNGCRKKRW